jgi:hypothetical protein
MQDKRAQRYRQKINFAAEKINDIPDVLDTPLADQIVAGNICLRVIPIFPKNCIQQPF